jgi:hypothetical protein
MSLNTRVQSHIVFHLTRWIKLWNQKALANSGFWPVAASHAPILIKGQIDLRTFNAPTCCVERGRE